MAKSKERREVTINSSSMADIAFLLLIFFLVTTQILNEKGLTILLPPKPEDMDIIDIKIKERNLFKVLINSADRILVEGEILESIPDMRQMVKDHVLNNGRNPQMSDSPKEAIISVKTDRGTSYEIYIAVLDEIQGAYYDMYAERAGLSNERWREVASDHKNPEDKKLYEQGRGLVDGNVLFPMNISIAEPSRVGG